MPKLTAKQERFALEYVVDLNATQAAIRAGYAESGARTEGARLLANAGVQAKVAELAEQRAEKTGLSAERVLAEIQRMAFYDPADLVEVAIPVDEVGDLPAGARVEVREDGNGFVIMGLASPRDIKRLPEAIRRAIVGWGWDRNQNFTIKLADKSKALDQLARHLGLFHDKLEVTGLTALADRLARAKGRTDGDA